MKPSFFFLTFLLLISSFFLSCKGTSTKGNDTTSLTKPVNPELFLTNDNGSNIETVDCTLSDGTKTKCFKITTMGIPTDHDMGPWCPEHTDDGADKGGVWFKDGSLYDVDGKFIVELPTLYHDDYWHLHDDEGNVNKTRTKEDCEELASAQLVDKFKNYCIECLPEYVSNLTKTYLIPITPVLLDEPISLGGPKNGGPGQGGPPEGGRESSEKGQGPPPGGGKKGPSIRGIAFNGVAFDAPAPTHLILSGYTIPPIDEAGGHINLDVGYHYHAATGVSTGYEQKDEHSDMIGYAMDGFGLYEQLDHHNKEPKDLDDCRGHSDATRGYHYHVDSAGNNNFINCFKGAIAEN